MSGDAALLTLGVEEEFHLVDLHSRRLVARGPEVLARLPATSYAAELQQCVVETNTAVCSTLDGLRAGIVDLRRELTEAAAELGLGVAAAGTVPLAVPDELTVSDTPRYRRMLADYQLLTRQQLICGMQVHVGLADRDLAVAVAQRVAPALPVLLALSASSPFWYDGGDSGYASARSLVWSRWPTAGSSGPVGSAADYDRLVDDLIASGVITDPGMIYFDVRPSAHVPTLELRVCDACPLVDDVVLIAGLFRALVRRERDAALGGRPAPDVAQPLHRAAMWRAARNGLEGPLVDVTGPRSLPSDEVVRALVDDLRPALEAHGDWDHVGELADTGLRRGSSAARQRRAFQQRRQLGDVVDLVLAETRGTAQPHAPDGGLSLVGPVPGVFDEAVADDGSLRRSHRELIDIVSAHLDAATLRTREAACAVDAQSRGVTFRVDGERAARPFPLDLIPRVVPADEWQSLSAGLTQRARALEALLRDVYGPGAVFRDGVLPRWLVAHSPGYRLAGSAPPTGATHAHVVGMDLVRDGDGHWRVLEDNLRVPSGVGYAVLNRQLTARHVPELPWSRHILDAAEVPALLRRTLEAAAPPGALADPPTVVLLSDGPGDSAYAEHRMLAEEMAAPLVRPAELLVGDGGILWSDRDGRRHPVDVIYRRIDEDTLAERYAGTGEPLADALTDAVRAGRLTVANAFGNGVADDKAVYAYVPALIEYYLGELALLDGLPTYLCGDHDQRAYVLERLDRLVVKPVDGYGGLDVVIGPCASADELAAARRRILADPAHWIAQEFVSLSTHPTFDGQQLEPRHVDLRAFVYHGERAEVVPAALTRVAPPGSLVVNSSRGGGSKDTWLLR